LYSISDGSIHACHSSTPRQINTFFHTFFGFCRPADSIALENGRSKNRAEQELVGEPQCMNRR
jgi:hypothetical protein